MRLLILGTGTCLGPLPGQLPRMPPLFALDVSPPEAPPRWVVFDCSEGARWRLAAAGVDPSDVHHVALTHPHPDHAAVPQFVQSRACEAIFGDTRDRDLALALYMPPLPAATLASLWAWHNPEDGGRPSSRFPLRIIATPDGFARELFPGVVLRAFHVEHGASPAVAYRVETPDGVFAYSGDTGLCDGVVKAARDADVFVCEAAARVGQDLSRTYGHLNPRQAGEVAMRAGARHVLLTHYTGHDPDDVMRDDALAAGCTARVDVARDGMRLDFAARDA